MRKSGRDIDLILLHRREENAGPLAKVRRPNADVNGDVQHFAFDDATELCLRMLQLIVKPAKRPLNGTGVVVLIERIFDTECSEFCSMVSFSEKTTRVAVNYGPQLIDTGERGFDSFHSVQSPARENQSEACDPDRAMASRDDSRFS